MEYSGSVFNTSCFSIHEYLKSYNYEKNTLKFLCIIFIISQLPFSGFAQGCVEASSDEGPQLVGYIQPQFNAYFFGSKDNGDAIKPIPSYLKEHVLV